MKPIHKLLTVAASALCVAQVAALPHEGDPTGKGNQNVAINGVLFEVNAFYDFFTWQDLPEDVEATKMPLVTFENVDGITHYYQVVYLPNGNLNWYQAAYLAADAGGYLASITSPEENQFVFELINDDKYFWQFPEYVEGKSNTNHHQIKIGPFLGGYQQSGAKEPNGGWQWLSGEPWLYDNWAKNLDDGTIDKDPRDNTQPNNSGRINQRIMGFGEMNTPVPTWADYMDDVGTYGKQRLPGRAHAFIIEYAEKPEM